MFEKRDSSWFLKEDAASLMKLDGVSQTIHMPSVNMTSQGLRGEISGVGHDNK